ncbi:MAG: ATP citrate lyase citrate-binding domain-containing protein [Bacillota bacterium]|nr:ATP citrate lyase citrate-binding domain-containing protein [Bacillota bacterium]
MAQRAIREYDAKTLLARHWPDFVGGPLRYPGRVVQVGPDTPLDGLAEKAPWLAGERLAVKPDVLAGRRGKHGLVLLDAGWEDARAWLLRMRGTTAVVGGVSGELTHFVVEPFIGTERQYYLAIRTERDRDDVLFSPAGGIDIEEHLDQVRTISVPVWPPRDAPDFGPLFDGQPEVPAQLHASLAGFCAGIYRYFRALGFAFMELNPFTVHGGELWPLDLKARLDDSARFECGTLWGDVDFPAPFGRRLTPEERAVTRLDERSGASLKLTVLNPAGRIWTMVAGGGASVVYTDTIADLGRAGDLGNYGEYSGNPSSDETYEYTRIVLDLLTRGSGADGPGGDGKCLIIGGGIANFTDVAATFAGIIRALREFAPRLRSSGVRVLVRRGGPNYREGLRLMRELGGELGISIDVYGPDTHMTRVIGLALGGAANGGA